MLFFVDILQISAFLPKVSDHSLRLHPSYQFVSDSLSGKEILLACSDHRRKDREEADCSQGIQSGFP